MVSEAEAGAAATHGGCTVAVQAVRGWLTAWRRDIDKLATLVVAEILVMVYGPGSVIIGRNLSRHHARR